jgi:uncharacterized protein HemY
VVTLPVPKKLADASLDAAIVVYVARHPGAMRGDIECSGAVAAILARTETQQQATEWLHERLKHLRAAGVIEKRHYHRGWFLVHAEAVAS